MRAIVLLLPKRDWNVGQITGAPDAGHSHMYLNHYLRGLPNDDDNDTTYAREDGNDERREAHRI